MRVWNLHHTVKGERARVSAVVTWEDCDRPEREIYFETHARFAADLSCNPNAFLVASTLPAMRHGEQRVRVEGKLCPQLRNGLSIVMQQLRRWYGEEGHRPVAIEATDGFQPPLARVPARTASFMSGGVDALATLRSNRLDFPTEHPGSIKDCLFLHGFDIGGIENLDHNERHFAVILTSLLDLARRAGVTLIPVYTNLRYIDDDTNFFGLEAFGAALAAVAHTFANRVTTALIPSSASVQALSPLGSHPLLDPNYSSANVHILHDGLHLSRREKVALLAQWDLALQHLRSCNDTFQATDALNCGKCEKCIRTMTHLLLCGKLRECPTYPLNDVSPEVLSTITPLPPIVSGTSSPQSRKHLLQSMYVSLSPGNVDYWREMVGPLTDIGRHDLVKVIESKLAHFERGLGKLRGGTWRAKLRRLDHKYLGGTLSKVNRAVKMSQ